PAKSRVRGPNHPFAGSGLMVAATFQPPKRIERSSHRPPDGGPAGAVPPAGFFLGSWCWRVTSSLTSAASRRASSLPTALMEVTDELSVPFSASAALGRGEIDWWENPARDLVSEVSGDPNITVVAHFATANGIMTFNHRYPPFDNPAIQRALLGAVDQ